MAQHLTCSGRLLYSFPVRPARTFFQKCSTSCGRLGCKPKKEGPDPMDLINDIIEDANALMAEVGAQKEANRIGEQQVPVSDSDQPRMTLHCDVNGCTIAPVLDDPASFNGRTGSRYEAEDGDSIEEEVLVMEGEGWKLGYIQNPSPDNIYHAFVGGKDWSISLTQEEYDDFIKLLKNLQRSVATLEICGEWDKNGSAEATLEMSTPRIWMQGRAPQHQLSLLQRIWSSRSPDRENAPASAFSLRFIVISAETRGFEGCWPDKVVMSVLESLKETLPQDTEVVDEAQEELVFGTE